MKRGDKEDTLKENPTKTSELLWWVKPPVLIAAVFGLERTASSRFKLLSVRRNLCTVALERQALRTLEPDGKAKPNLH